MLRRQGYNKMDGKTPDDDLMPRSHSTVSMGDQKKLLDEKGMESHLHNPSWGPSGEKLSVFPF